MQYLVQPGGALRGRLRVPGDKSISHRAVILGALAEGVTEVSGLLEGADVLATIAAFRAMGVQIDGPDDGKLRIQGVGLHGLRAPAKPLDCGNSGTAMRLLAGVLAGQDFPSTLVGDESLHRRPMGRVIDPLQAMGARIASKEGKAPLQIEGTRLHGIDYTLPMASAQVKSAILLAGLYAAGQTCVREPALTRDHSERMLRGFGYEVSQEPLRACLQGGGRLAGQCIDVPADISSATFFLLGATIAPGSDLLLENVGINPTRTGVIEILTRMGARIDLTQLREVGGEAVADIRVRSSQLHGIDIPPRLVPLAIDEFPAIFIAAACAEGQTRVREAEELRVKESDRIAVMAAGLRNLGVLVEETADGARIDGGQIRGGTVDSHGDHRIAMSFAMAALRAEEAIQILDCENVATSFPTFPVLARQAGLDLAQVVS
ncbi:3-phosphoshikimate 1-carboxyvinyltransferase [Acidithiobacillus sp. CV18-2]|uniref:3-phosphoshikimate 1-carboxyvinyltransferase n=1 Tax=Igneacidithiobacillus copahuensis TaxID=2724909 RepID=A0AAE2YMV3_9PROT|nr:3-phosphoshikimate 1-carboxyvinyltransferase [Igneacidithiobacillus copahuensis]MBU2754269.1 3-phosphoshikimate 1-carboxyvinyltransferase [Acidithiobacillus sp. CV18-3]MBU2778156.1 3-phosphoshikimate 1-carboxyvinyltransferase [Acidithiobacillus sp. CV18-2]MBU2796492.1 3-phosphoshikimate 1-carboxyvinyltransferase [Acidithiobacillus sp. VAN18-2]MBU2800118.1 3-phosphoshikimate 1-carboxyvinyltransferase [Acidithiobacillus sp. VAN18-4]UTV80025.1 3-phosphoshikimate 1-carboxyvinyltransferase [Acid